MLELLLLYNYTNSPGLSGVSQIHRGYYTAVWRYGFYFRVVKTILILFLTQENKIHKYVNYDHPGECSPEKDCLW